MCGRYALLTLDFAVDYFAGVVNEQLLKNFFPRYNIAPTQSAPIIRMGEDKKYHIDVLKWGLVPFWADDPSIGNRMINARADGVATKPSFRAAYKHRRCVVPASGFFEWRSTGGKTKQPFYIQLKSEHPLYFAGLWEHWDKGQGPLESFTIITTEPNELMKQVHDRMPVVLAPNDAKKWISGADGFGDLLKSYASDEMKLYPVSTLVNSPRNDLADCLQAV